MSSPEMGEASGSKILKASLPAALVPVRIGVLARLVGDLDTRLRPLLTYAIPSLAVQTLVELGRAYLMVDDTAGARTVLRQARGILQRRPDLGVLPGQAAELHAALDTLREGHQGCRRSPPPSCGCSRCWPPT